MLYIRNGDRSLRIGFSLVTTGSARSKSNFVVGVQLYEKNRGELNDIIVYDNMKIIL